MEDIRIYLDKPDAVRLYSEGLELFKKHALAIPEYSRHWAVLAMGPFGNNRTTLEDCLRSILKAAPTTPVMQPTEVMVKPRKSSPLIIKDQLQTDLYVELAKLRRKLKQTAQRFHDCHTDEERAQVCDVIAMVEGDIRKKDGDLAYVQRYGRLPEEIMPEEAPMPETLQGVRTEVNRAQSNILKLEKRLEFLFDLPEHDKRRADIAKKQRRMEFYVSRLIALKRLKNKMVEDERQLDATGNTGTE